MTYQEAFKLYTDFCKFVDDNRDNVDSIRNKFDEMINVLIDGNLYDINSVTKEQVKELFVKNYKDFCSDEHFEIYPYGMVPVIVIRLVFTNPNTKSKFNPVGLPGWGKFMSHYKNYLFHDQ